MRLAALLFGSFCIAYRASALLSGRMGQDPIIINPCVHATGKSSLYHSYRCPIPVVVCALTLGVTSG